MNGRGPLWPWLVLVAAMASARTAGQSGGDCLSWRVAVEAGNLRDWATVPAQCVAHVRVYMVAEQYWRDTRMVAEVMEAYSRSIVPTGDGMDAWVFDVDDTCLSNVGYYAGRRFGGDPFNRMQFEAWARTRRSTAIPEILRLFRKLVARGFKVFLISGRDEGTLMLPTLENLWLQGFSGFHRLIMRGPQDEGKSAVVFKSEVRRQLVEEGYRICGNVGDQWSDLTGNYTGDRTFKVPNPMYYVP